MLFFVLLFGCECWSWQAGLFQLVDSYFRCREQSLTSVLSKLLCYPDVAKTGFIHNQFALSLVTCRLL